MNVIDPRETEADAADAAEFRQWVTHSAWRRPPAVPNVTRTMMAIQAAHIQASVCFSCWAVSVEVLSMRRSIARHSVKSLVQGRHNMPTVRRILEKKGGNVVTVTGDATVLDAARKMNESHIGALCVMEGDSIVGMFTERDILNRVVAKQLDPASTRVEQVMTKPVVTCGPDAKQRDCVAVMSNKKIRHLPVVEGDTLHGKLVGVISTGDLMATEVDQKQAHIDQLHDYLHGRT